MPQELVRVWIHWEIVVIIDIATLLNHMDGDIREAYVTAIEIIIAVDLHRLSLNLLKLL